MYQGIFDTDFDKYTEDAVALFSKYGIDTVFENLEGFPKIGKRILQHLLSLYGNTSVRVFSNMESILT